jgi:acyl-CoA synthetase (NDP forming)
MMKSLDVLLRPRSVAVIGASNDVTRIGGRALRHLREAGFGGDIFPVNPGRDEVQGHKAYNTVRDIPGNVECAILALPSDAVLPAIEDCARKGVGGAVIFSAGFAEMGAAGAVQQQKLVDIARSASMRLLGPNCLGLFNLHAQSFLSFSGIFDNVKGTAGRLGLVSQSGGYAGEVVKSAQAVGLDFGTWITTGNEADVGFGEALHHLALSDDVDVVVGYLEGIRDRQAFFDGLAAAHRLRKPVVMLKVGRTEQGAKAAASHTASLAGSDGVYDAVFQRYGVYRARTTEEMLDVAYAASRGRFPVGPRLAILTNSGGIGVQAADFAADEKLEVPTASAAVQDRIVKLSPNGAPFNPIDLTGQVANDPPMFAAAVDAVMGAGEFDCAYLNIGLIAGLPFIEAPLLDSLRQTAQRFPTMPLAASVTASAQTVAAYEQAGYLCYREPARAIKALSALVRFPQAWNRSLPDPGTLADMPRIAPASRFSEAQAKALLGEIGIPSPQEHLVQNAADADEIAGLIGGPLAIKVVSPDILHKTEVGGVALNIPPAQAGACVEAMSDRVTAAMSDAEMTGFLISPMISGGTECIVGVHVDPLLGPVVMFGLGGIFVELLNDVTTRLAPVTEAEAIEMIKSVKGYPLLDGFRGQPKADVPALARAICAVSRLAAANSTTVNTIEVNPLLVLDAGQGVLALDAIIQTGL